jgi:hypothetical protein
MYFSVYHWRPLVNGYSGYAPAGISGDISERVQAFPALDSLRYLGAIGVRHILIHPDAAVYRRFAAGEGGVGADAVRRFPNGSLLVTLPEIPAADEVTVRVLAPHQLPAGGRHRLGVLFENAGASYWVNTSQRAWPIEIRLLNSAGYIRGSVRRWVLPPVALAPREMRERTVEVDIPEETRAIRLVALVTRDRRTTVRHSTVDRWRHESVLTLVPAGAGIAGDGSADVAARYLGHYLPGETCAGCSLVLRLHAMNGGRQPWTRQRGMHLGYAWTAEAAGSLAGSLPVEREVYPGQEVVIEGTIPSPSRPGTYQLTLGLVDDVQHLHLEGGPTPVRVSVSVR